MFGLYWCSFPFYSHIFAAPPGSSLAALSGLKGGFFIVDEQKRMPAFSKDVPNDALNPVWHFWQGRQDRTGSHGWGTETMHCSKHRPASLFGKLNTEHFSFSWLVWKKPPKIATVIWSGLQKKPEHDQLFKVLHRKRAGNNQFGPMKIDRRWQEAQKVLFLKQQSSVKAIMGFILLEGGGFQKIWLTQTSLFNVQEFPSLYLPATGMMKSKQLWLKASLETPKWSGNCWVSIL